MDSGRRVTLDNSGLGYRARSYANSYVPRPSRPAVVSDIVSTNIQKATVIEPAMVATAARRIIETPPDNHTYSTQNAICLQPIPSMPTAPKSESPKIDELLRTIQNNSRTTSFDSQLVQASPANHGRRSLRSLFKNKRSVAMSMAAVFLVVGGAASLFASFSNNKAVVQQVQALEESSSIGDTNTTGESTGFADLNEDVIPDSAVRSYSVAENYPKYIRIAKLGGKSSRILRMGIDENNTINTPRSIWDAGWYDGSALPSDSVGASLILGHVSGPNDPGIFYNLYRVIEGDLIEVEMGDGRVFTYRVVGKQEVPTGGINMNDYLVSKDVDKPGLTLMTCAGEFNPSTQQYENRLAVFAIRTN